MIPLLMALALAGPDRGAPPPVAPAAPLPLPEPTWTDLSDAVRLGVVRVPGVRLVQVQVTVHAGAVELDGWSAAPTSEATGWLMDVATAEHDAVSFEIARDLADAVVSSRVEPHALVVEASAPRERLAEVTGWLGDVLVEPAFPGAELRRWRRDASLYYRYEAASSPSRVGRSAMAWGWHPDDHPYGRRVDLDAIQRVQRADLLTRHRRALSSAPITALIVGDVAADEAVAALGPILTPLGAPGPRPDDLAPHAPTTSAVLAVDMPTEQATLGLRYAAPAWTHPDRSAFTAVDHALGGAFLSRLNANLREEHGYTYGMYSRYDARARSGTWSTSVEVQVEHVGPALAEIRKELRGMVEAGPTSTELAALLRERVASWNETFATAESALGVYAELDERRSSVDTARADLDALAALTPEDGRRAAAAWLSEDLPHLWVVVGPRDALEAPLADLGLPVTWITPEQAVLGTFDDPLERSR